MSDKNNNAMMNNNMNNDNDPKERMRKKVKKAAGIALCAVLAGGLAAGSFEGINTITGWNSSTVEAASNKDNATLLQTKSKKKSADKKSDDKESKDDSESKTKGSLDVSDIAAEGMKSVVAITKNLFRMYRVTLALTDLAAARDSLLSRKLREVDPVSS